jgi:predicted metalloprotease with PDZ domain
MVWFILIWMTDSLSAVKYPIKDFPKEEFNGNSFFSNKHSGTFGCNIRILMNSIFCAGSFRSKTVSMEGHQIVMAVYGKFPYTDDEAFSAISKIIIEERKFWADPGSRYFFMMAISTDDKGNSGGTGYYNPFSIFPSSDVQLTNGILQTISHEYFHNRIGSGLKNPNPDETYKWFSEGFTDYYSLKLLNKTGVLSKADFISIGG